MILVVEDHADTRTALVKMLGRAGHDAVGVGTGEGALMFMATSPRPRLVILDFHLPGMDGLEVLANVRADARLADVPVVFYTATDAARERALAGGANAYIRKASMDWLEIIGFVEQHAIPRAPRPATVAPPVA